MSPAKSQPPGSGTRACGSCGGLQVINPIQSLPKRDLTMTPHPFRSRAGGSPSKAIVVAIDVKEFRTNSSSYPGKRADKSSYRVPQRGAQWCSWHNQGLCHCTESFAATHELAGKGIRIQAVLPAGTATDFWDKTGLSWTNHSLTQSASEGDELDGPNTHGSTDGRPGVPDKHSDTRFPNIAAHLLYEC